LHTSDPASAAGFRGPHFTLLAIGDTTTDALPWPTTGAKLEVVKIPAGAAPSLTKIYGVTGPTQILVRPDGYIAHIATDNWTATLARSAQTLAPPFIG
jgi:hypothetical protein